MIKWAGRIMVLVGVAHLLLSLGFTVGTHAEAWLGGELWTTDGALDRMEPVEAAFWFSVGSFGLPLTVVGATVLWMHRRGIVPPAFIAWAIGAWSLVAGATVEPAPWIVATIAAGMLLAGVRRAARVELRAEPVAAS